MSRYTEKEIMEAEMDRLYIMMEEMRLENELLKKQMKETAWTAWKKVIEINTSAGEEELLTYDWHRIREVEFDPWWESLEPGRVTEELNPVVKVIRATQSNGADVDIAIRQDGTAEF